MTVYYDRKASPALQAALAPGGVAHDLVRRHVRDRRTDLHLRGYPHTREKRATLYCGLTAALHLNERGGQFWLDASPTWRAYGGDLPWKQRLSPTDLADCWPLVDAYLDRVVPAIVATKWFGKEGQVQNAVTRLRAEHMTVFDREAVPGFSNTRERQSIMEEEADGVRARLGAVDEPWWLVPRLGNECDAVALDLAGRMLCVEVKPANATHGIAWAPLQAAYYAQLFRRWTAADPNHAKTLESFIDQRAAIGLLPEGRRDVPSPLAIVPVVVIGMGPVSNEALRRCKVVRDRLIDGGAEREIPVWRLTDTGLVEIF